MPKITVPASDLSFTGKAVHFNGLISYLMVLLIKEEMHCSNVQLLYEKGKKSYYAKFTYERDVSC